MCYTCILISISIVHFYPVYQFISKLTLTSLLAALIADGTCWSDTVRAVGACRFRHRARLLKLRVRRPMIKLAIELLKEHSSGVIPDAYEIPDNLGKRGVKSRLGSSANIYDRARVATSQNIISDLVRRPNGSRGN